MVNQMCGDEDHIGRILRICILVRIYLDFLLAILTKFWNNQNLLVPDHKRIGNLDPLGKHWTSVNFLIGGWSDQNLLGGDLTLLLVLNKHDFIELSAIPIYKRLSWSKVSLFWSFQSDHKFILVELQ